MIAAPSFDASLLGVEAPERPKVAVIISDYPRDAKTLRIGISILLDQADPDQAELSSTTGNLSLRVEYSVKHVDLQAQRAAFWKQVSQIYSQSGVGSRLKDPNLVASLNFSEMRSVLLGLAGQGDELFRQLFSFPDELPIETERPRDRDKKIREILRKYFLQPRLIHFTSDAPLFPWGFLYSHETAFDGLSPESFHPEGFWGMRHEIQHGVPAIATALRLPSKPRIVAAVCPSITPSGYYGVEHPLQRADVEFIQDVPALRERLTNFDADCLYFIGHAHHETTPLQSSSQILLQGIPLSVANMEQKSGPKFTREPVLVFLNGCSTGHLPTWDTNTIAGYLVHRGDRRVCCLTTAANVPPAFAHEFSKRFWRRFLDSREHLGAAVLGTRKEIFQEFSNPLGLLYEVIGKIDTRISETVVEIPASATANEDTRLVSSVATETQVEHAGDHQDLMRETLDPVETDQT